MIDTKQSCIKWLESKPDWIYKVQEHKETRSQAQNRLYWMWLHDLVKCFDEKGIFITTDDLHEWLREKLIEAYPHKNTFTWELKMKRKSTTQLTKKEFNEYIDKVEKYLWQVFEIAHPLPTDIFYNQ